MRKEKASLTVEAIISFTIFLTTMFLLLNIVKLVLLMTILNNATAETAKTVATASYPIAIINEMQAGQEKKIDNLEPENLEAALKGGVTNSVIADLMGGNGLSAVKGSGISAVKNLIEGFIVEKTRGIVYDLKGHAANYICGNILKSYLDDCGIKVDPALLILRVVKIPETEKEYDWYHSEAMNLSEKGELQAKPSTSSSGTDGDFNADDVVICVEYPYKIALPFLPTIELTLRSVAIEHAWLHGTSSGPKRTEGIKIGDLLFAGSKPVYVGSAGTGGRYHTENCPTLWRGSDRLSIAEAKNRGLTECKVCKPGK